MSDFKSGGLGDKAKDLASEQGDTELDREQAAAQQAEQYGDQAAGTDYGETVAGQPEGFGGEQSSETAQGGSEFGGESQSRS